MVGKPRTLRWRHHRVLPAFFRGLRPRRDRNIHLLPRNSDGAGPPMRLLRLVCGATAIRRFFASSSHKRNVRVPDR
jgi:hypothetical protein